VQPVDPLAEWQTPPFEPRLTTLPDGRKAITARGACDDKGQVMTFIEACRAWKAMTGELPVGVTFLIEGAEEDGSKFLPEFVAANRDELKADVALVCDTGMWDKDTSAITTSLRGLVYEEVIVRCADRDLHSGLFGGAARNPIHVLAKVIADLHDENGRVTVPGFYEGVCETPNEVLEQWKGLNLRPEDFLGPIGLKTPAGENDRMLIEQIQSRPTCDVNGIVGGYTGVGAKTVIPAQASAKISFRLVGEQDPRKISDAFKAFVRARLPADCSVEFVKHKGSGALAVSYDMPALKKAQAALRDEWGRDPVTIGSGGSIPIVGDFKRTLGLDTLLVGFALDDDRVHSPNEKYDLNCFHKGARSWARILAALAS
jgi:acetylornithine deacetylase/succinyl-diaminopimelate desuccinylase-like protein